MRMKDIKVDHWYSTKVGIGKCLATVGRFPPACKMDIVSPFPRGVCFVAPKDVLNEVVGPEGA